MSSNGSHENNQNSSSPKRKMIPKRNFTRRSGWITEESSKKILLETNHYKVHVGIENIYMYDVTITPGMVNDRNIFKPFFLRRNENRMKKDDAETNRKVIRQFYKTSPDVFEFEDEPIHYAYDGVKTLFTNRPMRTECIRTDKYLAVTILDAIKYFEVVVKPLITVDMHSLNQYLTDGSRPNPLDSLKTLDIVLMSDLAEKRIVLGNGFIRNDNSNRVKISSLKEVAFGHFQTARMCAIGITLNVDRFTSTFQLPGEFLDVLSQLYFDGEVNTRKISEFVRKCADRHERERNFMTLTKFVSKLKGKKVYAKHMKYRKSIKIKDISKQAAFDHKFVLDDSKERRQISVADYFLKEHKIKLKYPELPCLVAGSKNRPAYYPLELLEIEKDQVITSFNPQECREMIKVCSKQTSRERFKIIQEAVSSSVGDCKPLLDNFKIRVDTNPITVEGVQLKHPKLKYGDDVSQRPESARWEMYENKVYSSQYTDLWCVINLSRAVTPDLGNEFVYELRKNAKKFGINLSRPEVLSGPGPKRVESNRKSEYNEYVYDFSHDYQTSRYNQNNVKEVLFDEVIKKNFKKHKPNLIIFIVKYKDDLMYRSLKYTSEVMLGLNTQLVADKTLLEKDDRRHQTFYQNLLLKINTKLEGINFLALNERKYFDGPVMIIGADVTHPGKGEQIKSSIAAVTASYDKNCYFYQAEIRAQFGTLELIADMYKIMKSLLKGYREKRETYPKHIVFYRDGVSDAMFQQFVNVEVDAMRRACSDYGCEPRFTVVIVQKRHHTKFMCVDEKHDTGRGLNIPSGTAIDQKIVSPHDYDFFLCSQESLQVKLVLKF